MTDHQKVVSLLIDKGFIETRRQHGKIRLTVFSKEYSDKNVEIEIEQSTGMLSLGIHYGAGKDDKWLGCNLHAIEFIKWFEFISKLYSL